jgi:transcriptional regulator with XRE-family HTH domain
MSLGERIRQRRGNLDITQRDLAQSVGATPQHISVIEQGKRLPSIELLAKLAQELGVSIDYLVTGKEGIITEIIPSIKADKTLNNNAKKALVTLVNELRGNIANK